MEQWYMKVGDGNPEGPVTTAQLVEQIGNGQVPVSALACPVGGTDWQPLAAYAELAAAVRLACPPPPPGAKPGPADAHAAARTTGSSAADTKVTRSFSKGRLRYLTMGVLALATLAAAGFFVLRPRMPLSTKKMCEKLMTAGAGITNCRKSTDEEISRSTAPEPRERTCFDGPPIEFEGETKTLPSFYGCIATYDALTTMDEGEKWFLASQRDTLQNTRGEAALMNRDLRGRVYRDDERGMLVTVTPLARFAETGPALETAVLNLKGTTFVQTH